MEINNVNSNTEQFSWRDYRKAFFLAPGGVASVLLALVIISIPASLFTIFFGGTFWEGLKEFFEPNGIFEDTAVTSIFNYFLFGLPLLMGEAFLALMFAKKKNAVRVYFMFLVHSIAWMSLALFALLLYTSGWSIIDRLSQDQGFIRSYFIRSATLVVYYCFLRIIVLYIMSWRNPNKSFSIVFLKWFFAHPIKFYLISALVLAIVLVLVEVLKYF